MSAYPEECHPTRLFDCGRNSHCAPTPYKILARHKPIRAINPAASPDLARDHHKMCAPILGPRLLIVARIKWLFFSVRNGLNSGRI